MKNGQGRSILCSAPVLCSFKLQLIQSSSDMTENAECDVCLLRIQLASKWPMLSNSHPTLPAAACHVTVNILATWIFLQCALWDCWVTVLAAHQFLLTLYDCCTSSQKTAYCKVGVLILNFLFWHTGRWWSSSSWNIRRWRWWKWWR